MPKRRREKKYKKIRPNVMIFCEGETEESYLNMIKRKYSAVNITKSKIKIKSCSKQGIELVTHAISYINNMKKKERDSFDGFYVMYDKDDQSVQSVQQALKLAKTNTPAIETIYSNECFELWLLLHFEPVTIHMKRQQLYSKLEKKMSFSDSYTNHKGENICNYLEDYVAAAFQNVQKNNFNSLQGDVVNRNPYTNIPEVLCTILAQEIDDF